MLPVEYQHFDMIVIGSGPSGGTLAQKYVEAGMNCLMLEAGINFMGRPYPEKKVDSNGLLYWGGGADLNTTASLGFLRAKVVGGGSIVNQALLDRFDAPVLNRWRSLTEMSEMNVDEMEPYYQETLSEVITQEIPREYRNKNAEIFSQGLDGLDYKWAPLVRAQRNCRYQDGNDCIVCLGGCPIDSKQSMAVNTIPKALKGGLNLESEFEVLHIKESGGAVQVTGKNRFGEMITYRSKAVTVAAGSIGNSKLLLNSGYGKKNKNIGKRFYSHPQFMTLALYDETINAHKGPFQALKSSEPKFKEKNFKLENVFASPMELAMLIPGFGKRHHALMKKVTQMASIEVAIRDQNPGTISVNSKGKAIIKKSMDGRDKKSRQEGLKVVRQIFESTGAKKIIYGDIGFGLHLMGGCSLGSDAKTAAVSPDFSLYGSDNIYCADSSIFPDAPGINPSLTIMALSRMASQKIIKEVS
jgi:choline dehydrogenase-like flavoprotein